MRWFKGFLLLVALSTPLSVPAPAKAPALRPMQAVPSTMRSGKPLPLFPGMAARMEAYVSPFRTPGPSRISSGFGWRRHPILGDIRKHKGLDLAKPYGTPVYPAQNGIVSYAGWRNGYGRTVEIKHPDGGMTLYGHLSSYAVNKGQLVHKGMLLGLVGSTGLSTGPHLHFEYRDAFGRPLDPRLLIATIR